MLPSKAFAVAVLLSSAFVFPLPQKNDETPHLQPQKKSLALTIVGAAIGSAMMGTTMASHKKEFDALRKVAKLEKGQTYAPDSPTNPKFRPPMPPDMDDKFAYMFRENPKEKAISPRPKPGLGSDGTAQDLWFKTPGDMKENGWSKR
ncbi:hypothetical protein HYALB_00000526 [Hymenoscyphus albidus]|uniref:Uncharacterized protein n=1 Tax=Hymenoscyphus albidus TaxID=595503 RepID=A0A9N9LYE0_9HELO|nr:hypothetical protein HYALB_00000526 [Hymenoscyphus albidus]